MKILNIDAFSKITRQISFGGKEYPVEDTSVQQFINSLKASETLEAAVAASGSEAGPSAVARSFEQAVVTVKESIPSMPIEMIRGLKLPAMTAVLEFIRGDNEEADAAPSGAESDAEKKPS